MARKEPGAVLKELESQSNGLSMAEAEARVKREGLNEIAREKRQSQLVILLIGLGVLSYLTGDLRAMIVIFVMVVLGIVLRFYQEMRADTATVSMKA